MISYLDTSAALKLIIEEPESEALTAYLQTTVPGGQRVVASWLLHTELHCAAARHAAVIHDGSVSILLESLSLVDLTRGDLMTAAALPGRLRSHDALHLAVALRIGADTMISYDSELAMASEASGIAVAAPR